VDLTAAIFKPFFQIQASNQLGTPGRGENFSERCPTIWNHVQYF